MTEVAAWVRSSHPKVREINRCLRWPHQCCLETQIRIVEHQANDNLIWDCWSCHYHLFVRCAHQYGVESHYDSPLCKGGLVASTNPFRKYVSKQQKGGQGDFNHLDEYNAQDILMFFWQHTAPELR